MYQKFLDKWKKQKIIHSKGIAGQSRVNNQKKELIKECIDELNRLTSFAPKEYTTTERMQLIRAGITQENFFCPVCGEPRRKTPGMKRFLSTCGKKDPEHINYTKNIIKSQLKVIHPCPVCGDPKAQKKHLTCGKKDPEHNRYRKKYYLKKRKETWLKKYGVENISQNSSIKEKKKKTTLKNHGVENPSQSLDIKEKKKETTLKNHGVENPMQNKNIKEKMIQSNLQKYGVKWALQSKEVRQKAQKTCLQKYNTSFYTQSKEFKNRLPEVKQKIIITNYPNINYERWSSLTKEFIEENFIDSNNHLMVQELMDYVGWQTPTSAYQKCHELGVKWTYIGGGFDPTKAATLYYIYDPQEDMYKIGITNYPSAEERFGKGFCSKRAIAILEQWDYEIGEHAYLAEQEVLKAFKNYRTTNPSWPEELGGKTEFFKANVLDIFIF